MKHFCQGWPLANPNKTFHSSCLDVSQNEISKSQLVFFLADPELFRLLFYDDFHHWSLPESDFLRFHPASWGFLSLRVQLARSTGRRRIAHLLHIQVHQFCFMCLFFPNKLQKEIPSQGVGGSSSTATRLSTLLQGVKWFGWFLLSYLLCPEMKWHQTLTKKCRKNQDIGYGNTWFSEQRKYNILTSLLSLLNHS